MLNIVEYGKDEYAFPSLLVLGCFDAIHSGHRELFKKAKLQAKINGLDLGVMMFRDGKGGKTLYSFEERAEFLKNYNVKFILAVDFNEEFKQTSALDFLHTIEDKLNVKAYMSGKDFRFGKGAKGKSSTLKNYADDEENGVWYMSVKDVAYDGEKISTTLIKSCLDEGDILKANSLLGDNFFVEGEVVQGAGRGGKIGFPTVNIVYPEWKYPVKQGVYKVKVVADGAEYLGIANFGDCPTFGDERIALEVNLDGYEGDLYGKRIKVEFLGLIRGIKKFASAEELVGQLTEDKASLTLSDEEFAARYPLPEAFLSVENTEQAAEPEQAEESEQTTEYEQIVEPEQVTEPVQTAELEQAVEPEQVVEPEQATEPEQITESVQVLSEEENSYTEENVEELPTAEDITENQ